MTKIAMITDTHWGVRSDSSIFHEHFIKFYDEVFFPYLNKHNIKTILHGGDLTDKRQRINQLTLNLMRKHFLDVINQSDMGMYILAGNHDCYYKNTNKVNSLRNVLREGDYVEIIDEEPKELIFSGLKILMVPWMAKDNFKSCVKAIESSKATHVLGHFDIQGFMMNAGFANKSGLKPSMFSRFDLVMSGHYHERSHSQNIQYLGAPYEMNWGDYDRPRGFSVLDTDTGELEFIPNLDTIHEKITYDGKAITEEEIDEIDVTQFKNKYIKIMVENKGEDEFLFDKFIERLQNSGSADIKIVERDILSLNQLNDEVLDVEDTLTIIKRCIDEQEVENSSKVFNFMGELYKEASDVV